MAINVEIERLAKVGYFKETTGSYGINVSGSQSYTQIKIIEATAGTARDMLDNSIVQQKKHSRSPKIVGRKRSSLSLQTYLCGQGTPLSGAATPSIHPVADVLQAVLGATHSGTGSFVASATDSGSFSLNAAGGFKAGGLIGLLSGTSGQLHVQAIKSVTTNAIVTQQCFAFTPSANQAAYNAYNCYLSEENIQSLQFHCEKKQAGDTWVLCGMQGGVSFELPIGGVPTVSFDLAGATWHSGTKATNALTVATYADADPLVFKDALVSFYPIVNTPAPNTRAKNSSVSVNPNVSYTDVIVPDGVENIERKVQLPSLPSGELTVEFEDLTHFNAWNSAAEYGLLIQLGTTPGKIVAIHIPRCQIVDWKRAANGELAGATITWEGLRNTIATASTGFDDLAASPIIVAFF